MRLTETLTAMRNEGFLLLGPQFYIELVTYV